MTAEACGTAYLRIYKAHGTWTVELWESDEINERPSTYDVCRSRYAGERVAAQAFERGAQWLRDYETNKENRT